MNGWYDPQNWLDIFDHFLLVIAAIGVAAVPSYFSARNHRSIKDTQKTIGQVRDQVVNGHADAPPLRADLDRVLAAIDRLGHDVTAIRRDLADEGERRRDHVAELREEVHRRITEINRKLGE